MSHSVPDANAGLPQWLAYLESLHHTTIDMGLERIRAVAKKLVLATPYVKITVAGTNGKGSVCAMLEAILLSAGYKTGVYTSPHLISFNERIRLNGEMATDAQIVSQLVQIEQARGDISLSYFEYTTLAALMLFKQQGIDVAVLEVGLGGRLDAVNLVDADCAIITSIDIDHTDYLGDTREKIAWEKAHVFRSGKPAICADPVPPQTLIDYARDIGADLWLFGKDFNYSGDRQQWAFGGRVQRRSGLAYPALRGANQLLNASAALAAIEALRLTLLVPQQAIRVGLAKVSLPGRLQILPGTPAIVLDVAHNQHAAAALGQNLDNMSSFQQTHAVVGMFNDKDAASVIKRLASRVDRWYCAGLEGPRGLSGEQLADIVRQVLGGGLANDIPTVPDPTVAALASSDSNRPGVKAVPRKPIDQKHVVVSSFNDPTLAFAEARKQASDNDRILVFGSFATVGPVLDVLGRPSS
ncbi:bifunctional tetrahydrofolate synthase/dihydrofolate synthase [Alcaligenaceae bacterium]|nr:bifunctional tetrahydrofolate synthase/dihydrofolate synthase [Alcaligenaceae bacterium]